MPRKTTDNPTARKAAEEFVCDHSVNLDDSRSVVNLFKTVEFETATSRVGGEEIAMRRIVLTGPWEVVAQGQ